MWACAGQQALQAAPGRLKVTRPRPLTRERALEFERLLELGTPRACLASSGSTSRRPSEHHHSAANGPGQSGQIAPANGQVVSSI